MKHQNTRKLYSTAIDQFNRAEFFECHETLETIWRNTAGDERFFYQGILHIAVGLFHFNKQNYRGASSQLEKAKNRLEPFGTIFHGTHLKQLLEQAELFHSCAKERIIKKDTSRFQHQLPKIKWDSQRFGF